MADYSIPWYVVLITYLHAMLQHISNLSTIYMEYIPGDMPSSFDQKKCTRCHNHNTSLYWEWEGHASPMPMQPTTNIWGLVTYTR